MSACIACTIISAITASDLRYIDYAVYLRILRFMLNNKNNSKVNALIYMSYNNNSLFKSQNSQIILTFNYVKIQINKTIKELFTYISKVNKTNKQYEEYCQAVNKVLTKFYKFKINKFKVIDEVLFKHSLL